MSEQFSWTCPSCARKVPTRVAECRCGTQRADTPPALPDSTVATPGAGTSRATITGVAVAAAIAGALAMVPMLSGTTTAPAGSATPAPAPAVNVLEGEAAAHEPTGNAVEFVPPVVIAPAGEVALPVEPAPAPAAAGAT